jgi:hypothetical protein
VLRRWRAEDEAPMMAANRDPEVARPQRVATKPGMALSFRIRNPLLGRDVDVWELPGH